LRGSFSIVSASGLHIYDNTVAAAIVGSHGGGDGSGGSGGSGGFDHKMCLNWYWCWRWR